MNEEGQLTQTDNENPFDDMGFIKFWVVSTIFWMTFPASILVCYLTIGPFRTKQFIRVLINDFLQTILVILVVTCLLIYVIFQYVFGLF